MTNCPKEDILLDYIAGRQNAVDAAIFDRHADQCAHCAALRTAQLAVWRSLDEWKPTPVSAGFNRELWRRIDAEAKSPSLMHQLTAGFNLWKRAAPLAVAVALVVSAFVLDHSRQKPVKMQEGAVLVTAGEADQLEQTLDDMQLLHQVNVEAAAAKADQRVM